MQEVHLDALRGVLGAKEVVLEQEEGLPGGPGAEALLVLFEALHDKIEFAQEAQCPL
jgi:hypothetical protein